jgi:putative ABC transport system permease protein
VISVLGRKLLRELLGMKGQALAIAAVIAGGTATYVLSTSSLDTLMTTQAHLYRDYRFADVFAACKRAPRQLLARIAEIPGVAAVEARVAAPANLDLPFFPDPVTAQVLSLNGGQQPALNRLWIKGGRLPEPGRDQEVMISDGFATAHGIQPGQSFTATIFGRRRRLDIVGIAGSPEFIYQLQPGSIVPDFKSYAIIWMNHEPLEAAFNMKEAFNQISLRLERGAVAEDVIARLDRLLEPYGGLGAHARQEQISHKYLSEEFKQLQSMATMFPAIFLSVAAFLLNVVISRLMATQRTQIAILKAFGYETSTIVGHFLKLAAAIVLIGVALGIAGGAWMGSGMSNMYMEFYRFPYLEFTVSPRVCLFAALIGMGAAAVGAVQAVIKYASEPPASAMQPASPGRYRTAILERFGLGRGLTQPTRMILRNIERRPIKALLSTTGVAFSAAILVMGGFWGDAVDFMVVFQFQRAQRDDLTVTFREAISEKALYSLVSLPGVTYSEPFRSVSGRLRHGHREYRTAVQGLGNGGDLRRLLNRSMAIVDLPPDGLVLTDHLAKILDVRPGDRVTVETLEGRRRVVEAPLVAVVQEYVGVSAYMEREGLNRLLREGQSISGAYLSVDKAYSPSVLAHLRDMPAVAGTSARARMLTSFYETMARQMLIFAFFNTLLAATIAVGVVYNTARIAFSERSRELASLRVLGYTRGEISYILLGELAILVLAAIPLGLVLGKWLAEFMTSNMQNDLFRIPSVISTWSFSFATLVVLIAAIVSGLIVRRKLDQMDLVEVLKTRE